MSINKYHELFASLGPQDLLITVNQRLASYLQEKYGIWQQTRKQTIWAGDAIISWKTWQESLWQQALLQGRQLPLVLSSEQERAIWQEVLMQSESEQPLLSIESTAASVQKAWQLWQEWQLPLAKIEQFANENVLAFLRWAQLFQQRCQQSHFISQSEQLSQLSAEGISWRLPKRLILAGFAELSPAQQQFLNRCQSQGLTLTHWQTDAVPASVTVMACHDQDSEYRNALRYAYEQVQSKANQHIAIVIPELQQNRQKIERLAQEILQPPQGNRVVYAISGGQALSEYPIIHDALLILKLARLQNYEQLSAVLRSPFIMAAEQEQSARDRWDRYLREQGLPSTNLEDCLVLAGFAEQCPVLFSALQAYQRYHCPQQATVDEWVRHWLQLLKLLGWPGQRQLNSAEYQIVSCFYQQFAKLETYQVLNDNFTASELLTHFERLLFATPFQPESPANPQVRILGLLEAVGMDYEQIWVCGLNEESFPAAAKPNPFLPVRLQRQLNLPHATAERELQYAQKLLVDLRQQCQQLYLSYPCWQDDVHFSPSPLLRDYPCIEQNDSAWRFANTYTPIKLESIDDTHGSPLAVTELMQLKGGYKLFQQQALCPFQAFASQRLQLEAFPEFNDVFDHRLRGIILHSVLERLWQQLKDRSTLQDLLLAERQALINKVVTQVLNYWQQKAPKILTPGLADLEQQRLNELMAEWLVIEAQRTDFSVLAHEQVLLSEIAGIPIKMRVDRIDQLANGKKLVIDYKTGMVNCKDWFGDRPSDPQLPLYAILTGASGIAYAQLRKGELGFAGVTAEPEYLPSVSAVTDCKWVENQNWDSLLSLWQQTLIQLAEGFKQGHAAVAPKSIEQACRYCQFQALCRIHDKQILPDEPLY